MFSLLSNILSQTMIGLDIRPHGLHLIQLRRTGKKTIAENAACIPLPNTLFAEGQITQWDALQDILHDVVNRLRLTGKSAAIHLPSNLVRIQQMELPLGMKEAAIQHEISMKLSRDFQGIDDQLIMDFDVLVQSENKTLQVYYAITRKEYVSRYVDCVKLSGLKIKKVDVDLFALRRAFPFDVNGVVVEVNQVMTLLLFSTHEILFHYEGRIGDDVEFRTEISKQISIFMKSNPRVITKRLVVYSQYQDAFNEGSPDFEIQMFNPFSIITFTPQFLAQIESKNLADFVWALGLAHARKANDQY